MMTVYDVWKVSPKSHVMILVNGKPVEYVGEAYGKGMFVDSIEATRYAMYRSVVLITIKEV